MPTTSHKPHKAVAHHLPHRTRIKIPRQGRDAATMKRLHDSLKKTAGVKDVSVNERTGSIVVHHEEDPKILETISTSIEEVVGELLEAVLEVEGIELPGLSIIAHLIRQRLGAIDNHLAKATNNMIDLKMLVPVLFFGAGVFQARRNVGWLDQVPAWVLFYYAYDAYMKFHTPQFNPPSREEQEAEAEKAEGLGGLGVSDVTDSRRGRKRLVAKPI